MSWFPPNIWSNFRRVNVEWLVRICVNIRGRINRWGLRGCSFVCLELGRLIFLLFMGMFFFCRDFSLRDGSGSWRVISSRLKRTWGFRREFNRFMGIVWYDFLIFSILDGKIILNSFIFWGSLPVWVEVSCYLGSRKTQKVGWGCWWFWFQESIFLLVCLRKVGCNFWKLR